MKSNDDALLEASTRPLIGPLDPPPFAVVNPEGRASVLLICDHASRAIPEALGALGLGAAEMERHIAYDIGAAAATRALAAGLDAPAVLAGYSRLVIDVNRQPGDPDSILAESDNTPIPGNAGLSEDDAKARAEAFFWPYHRAVADLLAHLWRRGPAPAVFSIHSFTPTLNGEERHWDVGILWNRDPRLALPLIERLRADRFLRVGDNQPYSGRDRAYSLDVHAGAAGLPNCAVEIRQDHLEAPGGPERWAGILADALGDVLSIESLHWVEHF